MYKHNYIEIPVSFQKYLIFESQSVINIKVKFLMESDPTGHFIGTYMVLKNSTIHIIL